MGGIDERYILEAMPEKLKPQKQKYIKYAAIAACFIIIIAIPYYSIVLRGANAEMSSPAPNKDNMQDMLRMLDFGNAYYEIVDDRTTLERIGLPQEITPDMLGRQVSALEETVADFEYKESTAETDCALYEYSAAPLKSVYILRDGEKLNFAVFCNYHVQNNESLPLKDAFEIYGVSGADDIEAFWKADQNYNRISERFTEKSSVEALYRELTVLEASSFDEFHGSVFAPDFSNESYVAFADSGSYRITFRAHGMNFSFRIYSEYGWVYCPQTLSYYKISQPLADILNQI